MAEETPAVGIIMGSESDMPAMEPCMAQLDAMGVRWRRYDDKYFFRYQNLVDKQGAGVC